MEPKKILILSQNTLLLVPGLERGLDEANVNFTVEFKTTYSLDEADLIFADYTLFKNDTTRFSEVLKHSKKLAILTSLIDQNGINEILRTQKVHHVFGLSGPNSFSDVRDFIISYFTRTKWSSSTFIKKPSHKTIHFFESSKDIHGPILELINGHDFSKWFEGIEDYLIQILNESISNALFNAPADDKGAPLYRHLSRKNVIQMPEGNAPVVEVISDKNKVVISVTDFYGTLTEKEIFDFITKGEITEKQGGAGIGIYLIFKFAHKLIINIEHKKYTEFLIVIERDKRFKWFTSKEKSFHLFQN